MKNKNIIIIFLILSFFLYCFSLDSDIKINSLGFLPNAKKVASISAPCSSFILRDAKTNASVFSGKISLGLYQADVNQNVYIADFSSHTFSGNYYLDVSGVGKSITFPISDSVYNFAYYTCMRAFYLWRCGMAVEGTHNGNLYKHAACHLKDGYLDYIGGGHVIKDGTRGWHDAGDYNKYVTNAGITLGCLFLAWEHFKDKLEKVSLNLPETAPNCPDFLKELKWEVDWILKMQYPDGSGKVSHKLSAKNFNAFVLPEFETDDRYFVDWSSSAVADFVAICAMASRIFSPYNSNYADTCLRAAVISYNFLKSNPSNKDADQSAFGTGAYTTSDPNHRIWAAAEMWQTTGSQQYLNDFETQAQLDQQLVSKDFDWPNPKNIGLITYALSQRNGKNKQLETKIKDAIINCANQIVSDCNNDVYGRPLGKSYYWGCNGTVARQVLILQAANMLSPKADYINTSLDAIGHIFGRNYYNRSYVTGLGKDPPKNPHDRRSGGDNVVEPWPGYLVGGGHTATTWHDEMSDYETNEIAINWQAALVYALAGFIKPQQTIIVKSKNQYNNILSNKYMIKKIVNPWSIKILPSCPFLIYSSNGKYIATIEDVHSLKSLYKIKGVFLVIKK
jgi:endoglucanase